MSEIKYYLIVSKKQERLEALREYKNRWLKSLTNIKDIRRKKEAKKHYQKYKEFYKIYAAKYRRENREAYRKHARRFYRSTKWDPVYIIKRALRSRLSKEIRKVGANKKASTMKLLGCSAEDFKNYFENKFKEGMVWENYGTWHIDHIKPCVSFDLIQEEEQKKCFHYTNLQPLWAKENYIKGGKINYGALQDTVGVQL